MHPRPRPLMYIVGLALHLAHPGQRAVLTERLLAQ